jgi:hypothetical protein
MHKVVANSVPDTQPIAPRLSKSFSLPELTEFDFEGFALESGVPNR